MSATASAVAVADINGDGWPDIYVSNDITPNDVLYLNQRNGTFRNVAAAALKHTSYAGMGVDNRRLQRRPAGPTSRRRT